MAALLAAVLLLQESPMSRIAELIEKLYDADIGIRQEALGELIKRGDAAVPALREAAKASDSEVASRAAVGLRKIEQAKNAGKIGLKLETTIQRDGAVLVRVTLTVTGSDVALVPTPAVAAAVQKGLTLESRRDGKSEAVEAAWVRPLERLREGHGDYLVVTAKHGYGIAWCTLKSHPAGDVVATLTLDSEAVLLRLPEKGRDQGGLKTPAARRAIEALGVDCRLHWCETHHGLVRRLRDGMYVDEEVRIGMLTSAP